MLQVPGLVVGDVGLGVAIAGARDQRRGVDDQLAEVLEAAAEGGQAVGGRPDVGRGVAGEIGEAVGGGALEVGVLVEGAVDIVGALEGVEVAGPEGLFAAGPADQVVGFWPSEGLYRVLDGLCSWRKRGEVYQVHCRRAQRDTRH